jgi:hypothetical protein
MFIPENVANPDAFVSADVVACGELEENEPPVETVAVTETPDVVMMLFAESRRLTTGGTSRTTAAWAEYEVPESALLLPGVSSDNLTASPGSTRTSCERTTTLPTE